MFKNDKERDAYWNKEAQQLLVGKRVKSVSWMTAKEAEEMGWESRPVVIEFEDGTTIYPSQDDEGNGAGSLFTNNEKTSCLPVL